MRKLFLSFAVAALCMTVSAQQYIIVNDELPVLASDVEKITYEQDDQFDAGLLPGILAADTKTQLFSQALQLTGLADTLRSYLYKDYVAPEDIKYYYKSHTWSEVAWYNKYRLKAFTLFVETDDVLAAQGITNIEQLKAYARQVYDEAFPEDAGVSDPTDRRNSLNRFVAYHILPFGSSYWYLTFYDGEMTDLYVDETLTDVNVWYGTLMPQGSLKCSYPLIGDDSGVYLNRRGLKDGPDKYGKQVRGVKVVADSNAEGEEPFTHKAFNGYYYHIDGILAYDRQTRDDVLGSELWRMDFKTLSSDIMNNADELRGNYLVDDNSNVPDDSPTPKNGRNYIYKWDSMENIEGEGNSGLVARRAHSNFWSWQGDEINLFGQFNLIVKLPPLPAGEWEVRMGLCALNTRPAVRVWLNGQVTIDSLAPRRFYYGTDIPFSNLNVRDEILDYLSEHVFTVTKQDHGSYLITDVKTGEQMVANQNPLNKDFWNRYSSNGRDFFMYGTDPVTGEELDWTERGKKAIEYYLTTFLPKIMHGPRECKHFYPPQSQTFYENERLLRYVLGRITSDGKSDNYLRLETLNEALGINSEMMLDYFEFVPKFVYDNTEIPEE